MGFLFKLLLILCHFQCKIVLYYFRTGIALRGREISIGQYEEMITLELGRILKLQQKIAVFFIPTVEMVCQN